MTTITLKRIPAGLHRALKQRAARNRRSLNSEVLATLESKVGERTRDVDALLEEAAKFRKALNFTMTQEELDAAKWEGRA